MRIHCVNWALDQYVGMSESINPMVPQLMSQWVIVNSKVFNVVPWINRIVNDTLQVLCTSFPQLVFEQGR